MTSSRFGYCLTEPSSWSAETSSGSADQLLQNDGPAVVTVQAISLKSGTSLSGFASQVRSDAGDSGLTPSAERGMTVDGISASSWDSTSPDGSLSLRDVVFVNGFTGWVVEFTDTKAAFGKDSQIFNQMIASWRFR